MENTFLSGLDWRNAEKNFDPAKKVSDEDLNKILHAAKMSPSSFGLQPFHVYVVSDQATKLKLKEKGFNQQQFEDCSHVLVFCGRDDLIDRINRYFEIASGGDMEKRKAMEGYENMMEGFDARGFDQILNIPAGTNSVAVMTIGYRKDLPHMGKVRFPEEDLFTRV